MGASGWSYWVDWQEDVGQAMSLLQERTFAEGKFFAGWDDRGKAATTISELRSIMAEEGTHSILDMHRIGSALEVGVVSGLSEDQLDALFETTTPTRAQVEAEARLIRSLRERWEGIYIVTYDGGAPSQIYFGGSSGG